MAENPKIVIQIEVLPIGTDRDYRGRLRMALKTLLRAYGLRCLGVTAINDKVKSTSADDIATSVQ